LIIATLEREARLFGLDAPTRVNVGVSDVEFAERTASLIESLGLQPPKELVRLGPSVQSHNTDVLDVEVEPAGGPSEVQSDDGVVPPGRDDTTGDGPWSNI
jgi:hypothetical protein